ncbi:sonic hedgehog protein A-like [Limulus polyphemus]|uniref:Hedgehog protein n=1 Tax=Limulus polyphemus TaxID=6850 RepID=A0ABM1C5N1_LIMPO|nr:sonic hedgehog protein A-like [Limulus polyphemus]
MFALLHMFLRSSTRPRYRRWGRALAVLLLFLIRPGTGCGPGRGSGIRRSSRKLTPLVFKQHVPNVAEKTLAASGLNEGILRRDDERFQELVPNYNSDIIFKDEEGTGADRLMTQRCKEKLDTLAISVMNQWPGVRLRVTEGWDEELHHAVESLHYEGRAVDITTNDRDRSKYGMLARLAVEAGFDWVYYESRSHIHCSVKSESSEAAKSGGCFHSDGIVRTKEGPKKLSEIKIGDEVVAVDRDAKVVFSEVILFLDRDVDSHRQFYVIETESGIRVTLTPNHLIFMATSNSSISERKIMKSTLAKNVQAGDFIYVYSDNSVFKPAKPHVYLQRVKTVSVILDVGIVAPLTHEGNLIVDDVVVSCYAVLNYQYLAHLSFAPLRFIENVKDSTLHLLQRLHMLSANSSLQREVQSYQKGIHWYAKLLFNVASYIMPRRYINQ